ncbi:MAG: hypothetical protein HY568_00490, partial [Candidatus Latescibacteria bacterium]|nr:hypothetical protein [Candidatus Latescibacterota bacterium]
QQPAFGTADTTTRTDSLLMFPTTQFAPVETIGANVLNQGAALDGKPAPSKRGIFGIHPTAIIAAMIALHIVVVGIVAK